MGDLSKQSSLSPSLQASLRQFRLTSCFSSSHATPGPGLSRAHATRSPSALVNRNSLDGITCYSVLKHSKLEQANHEQSEFVAHGTHHGIWPIASIISSLAWTYSSCDRRSRDLASNS